MALAFIPFKQIPYSQEVVRYLGICWLVWELFWFPYHLLNEELEQRDAEQLKTSPRVREDRAFRLLSQLVGQGRSLIHGGAPDQIEQWDKKVRLTLSEWCTPACLQNYMMYSRTYGEERIEDQQKAVDHLSQITEHHLAIYIK